MIMRFISYISLIVASQFICMVLLAPQWIFFVTTVLFLGLILLEVIPIVRYERFKEILTPTQMNDPSNDLETAKRVQEALLSIEPPQTDRVKIVRRCVPASTLGGDFYTFINKSVRKLAEKSDRKGIVELVDHEESLIGVTIGDVAGHGVSSALVMALASGLLGRIGLNNRSPAIILQRANVDIQKFISQSQISHVTVFYSTINLDKMSMTFAGAGHPAAILLRKDMSYELLEANGIFLGMYPDEIYEEKTVALTEGDRLLFYTDGIIETSNSFNEAFGTSRLVEIAMLHSDRHAEDLVEIIFEQLYKFREGEIQRDDQTLVIVDIN
jgi:sigma-B regulation protein RsbU (phosphoserine phosphatase)